MNKAWAEQYNNLKPITEAQKKYHWLRSAQYIFVHDKSGNAMCSRCGSEINVGRTKHKQDVVCPNCTNKLNVQHEWRMSKRLEVISWMIIPKVINDHTLCLRYVLAYQSCNKPYVIEEKARLFIDERRAEPEYWCMRYKHCDYSSETYGWHKGKSPYFVIPSYMTPNRFFCMYGLEYERNFFREINKLDCFKYYPAQTEYKKDRIVSQLIYMIRSARVNEKLRKVKMNTIAEEHFDYFLRHGDRCYPLNYKATSLIDMLKLDKPRYDALKHNPTTEMMFYLQNHKDVNVMKLAAAGYDTGLYEHADELANKVGVSFGKMCKYLVNNKINYVDYTDYLDNLDKLNYSIKDLYYSMPKDFDAADTKTIEEYEAKFDKAGLKSRKAKDLKIKKISDALRAMPNLKEFLDGSNGLLVYVPESSTDLKREGRNRHNCVGTYVDRIAEGKTLVFFVRRLNDPTAPFIDMEICNGKIVQIREDHNKSVTDSNVIDFCKRFATALTAA